MQNQFSSTPACLCHELLLPLRRQRIARALSIAAVLALVLLSTKSVDAFRVNDVGVLDMGILRWDAEPHFVDGVERSLDGGLRYSVQGGSYEAYRDLFQWNGTTPDVSDFQIAVEQAFGDWEAMDPATGLGTELRFVPDLDTPVFAHPLPDSLAGYLTLNPGAEIDLLAEGLGQCCKAVTDSYGDPVADSVTLTSGVLGYEATVAAGADVIMSTDVVWSSIEEFQRVLSHELGHAIGLADVDWAHNRDAARSRFYDDNYDDTSSATAGATLSNVFAHLIDPLDPDNSPALMPYDICERSDPNDDGSCVGDPGIDSPGVEIHMESSPSGRSVFGPQNDDFAGRQFLYPFIRTPGDFNADSLLSVEDVDLLSGEMNVPDPRFWYDLNDDGSIDDDDRRVWVSDLKQTYFGDTDLDGQVDAADLNNLALHWQASIATSWAQGDFNGDGNVNANDLNNLALNWRSGTAPAAGIAAVPEPSSIWLAAVAGLIAFHWITRRSRGRRRSLRPTLGVTMFCATFVCSEHAHAFRVFDLTGLNLGITRWNAAPHFVDGIERSLDGGLRYSVEGGSYEALRDAFTWSGAQPSVAEFQEAVEQAFAVWEELDLDTGLGSDLHFVPDFATPAHLEPVPPVATGLFRLNRGAEIDIFAARDPIQGRHGGVLLFGDPNANSATLTSGVSDYPAAVLSGADIYMNDEVVWNLDFFRDLLAHEIGHALGLGDVDSYHGDNFGFLSRFYDDNYDDTSEHSVRETLANPYAHRIDPRDPDNSPGLSLYDVCTPDVPDDLTSCMGNPGIDTSGVVILMEGTYSGSRKTSNLKADDFAGRQFLYPFVRVPGDFDGDSLLTVDDVDALSSEITVPEPRFWFDLDGDEIVDAEDRQVWISDLKQTYFGDTNLDGQVDAADLNNLALSWQASDANSWAQGDFNGDRNVNANDLNNLALNWRSGTAQAAVPEPSTNLLLLAITLVTIVRRSHRRT